MREDPWYEVDDWERVELASLMAEEVDEEADGLM